MAPLVVYVRCPKIRKPQLFMLHVKSIYNQGLKNTVDLSPKASIFCDLVSSNLEKLFILTDLVSAT
jgi:hypothetical protein